MRRLFGNHAAVLPVGLTCIVAIILMPCPPWLMELLLGVSGASSLGLLLLSMLVERRLPVSSFHGLLLISTLLRLAWSIATLKLTLLQTQGGLVTEAVGQRAVDGNFVVGMVIFVVIAVVQFVVLDKVAARATELGARPARGSVADKRKSNKSVHHAKFDTNGEAIGCSPVIDRTSRFHGSADGFTNFVRGDALVTMLLIFVNFLAGIAIGIGSKGMSLALTFELYAIPSLGFGLVALSLSFIASLAAGSLIVRTSGTGCMRLSEDIRHQLTELPMLLLLIGAACCVLAWVPGLPQLQTAGLGALLLAGGMAADGRLRLVKCSACRAPKVDAEVPADLILERKVPQRAPSLWVALSPSMARSFDALSASSELLECRARLVSRSGLALGPLRLFIDDTLAGTSYDIHVHELSIGVVHVPPQCWAHRAATGGEPSCEGALERAELQAFGSIVWVPAAEVPAAEVAAAYGSKWLSVYALLACHLEAVVMSHAGTFVGLEETSRLIASLHRELPELTREALEVCPLPRATEVLRRLANDRVSLRDMQPILQSLLKWAPREHDPLLLAEHVRLDLGPSLIQRFIGPGDCIDAVVVDPAFEHELATSMERGSHGPVLSLEASKRSGMDSQLRDVVQRHVAAGGELPVLVAESIRAGLSALVSRRHPQLCVFSYSELPSSIRVVPLAVLQPAIAS